jgi:hypothetical protein
LLTKCLLQALVCSPLHQGQPTKIKDINNIPDACLAELKMMKSPVGQGVCSHSGRVNSFSGTADLCFINFTGGMSTMSISGITTSQSSALSLISGTAYESNTSVNDVLAQGQSSDATTISKGAQQMNQLQQLQSTDPEKFKEAAQKISDALTEQASSTTDSHEAEALNDMASKFAEAAKSGTMDSLQFKPPTDASSIAGSASSQQKGVLKFKNQQGSGNPMATMDSVISNVLSNTSSSTTSSTSSVSASSETAA